MKTFIVDNFKIEVTDGLEAYNKLRLKYQDLAEATSKEFDEQYTVLFDDIDDIHKQCPELAQKYLIKTVDTAIRDIIQAGITDISDDIFINKYVAPRITWENDFLKIDDQYMKIVLDSDAYNDYKNSRSNSSGNIMGGGFGVEGAVTGMAIATAANLAIGAVGGILNAASDGLNSLGEKKLKKDLFDDPDTRLHLVKSVYNLVFQIHLSVLDVIFEQNEHAIYEKISDRNQSKADAIFQNIKKDRIPDKNIKTSLIDAMKLNPYFNELYEFWINKYSDYDKELLTIANYFGLKDIDKPKKTNPKQPKEYVEVENHFSSLTDEELKKNNTKNNVFVDENRKFDNKVYDTPEEANKMRVLYVKKFLDSGKKTEEGKTIELNKIFEGDKRLENGNLIIGSLAIICIIGMFFYSPWWHFLIILIIGFAILTPIINEESTKKKILKEWLDTNQSSL